MGHPEKETQLHPSTLTGTEEGGKTPADKALENVTA